MTEHKKELNTKHKRQTDQWLLQLQLASTSSVAAFLVILRLFILQAVTIADLRHL